MTEKSFFQVKALLNKRFNKANQCIEYLVWWKGYSKKQSTWEPSSSLQNTISALIDSYQQANSIKKRKKARAFPVKYQEIDSDKESSAFDYTSKQKYPIKLEETTLDSQLLTKSQICNRFRSKLNQKLKDERQSDELKRQQSVEVVRLVHFGGGNNGRSALEIRMQNNLQIMSYEKVKELYARELCTFYQKIIKIYP